MVRKTQKARTHVAVLKKHETLPKSLWQAEPETCDEIKIIVLVIYCLVQISLLVAQAQKGEHHFSLISRSSLPIFTYVYLCGKKCIVEPRTLEWSP